MNNLVKYISFTKNETKIILFIVTVLVTGFSIKYYKQVTGSSGLPYDFSKSDSEFREKSNSRKNNKFNITDGSVPNGEKELSLIMGEPGDSSDLKNNQTNQNNSSPGLHGIININTATKDELIDLPGIGESIAGKILSYRDEKKGFKKAEDIMKVKGIGRKKFDKIKDYIKAE